MTRKRSEPPMLIDRPAAAYQLGVSVSVLDSLVHTGQLSAVRIAGRVLFLRSVLYEFALDRLDAQGAKARERAGIAESDKEIISGRVAAGRSPVN
jgi:hypothetical protein